MSGLGAVVARTPGGREVASSILVAPTIEMIMKYAFVTVAILAIWFGTILLAMAYPEIGLVLPLVAIGLTLVLFVIGFSKK